MTTPVKKTALTDPDNVMWVVEDAAPPGEEVETEVTSALRPKMSAYSALVAATKVSLKKKFDESKVKRNKGKFAKKAGSGAATPTPAKKAAPAAPSTSGKKMTNKIIYGKHANGTIITTTDGQHRMIYNEAGNNWTVQQRTPDGGWETVDILGKGAAYKKSQELSDSWGELEAGTPATLTPVPGPATPSGPFAPGWNDLSGAGITNFKKLQVTTAFETFNPSSTMSPALMAQNVANIAQTYGLEPEQVLALIDEKRGDTAFSDAVQAHLNGDPFPDPMYPSVAKKAAAMKKATAKKIAPAAPVVAPAPAPVAPPAPATPSAPTYTAMTGPVSLALLGEPFEFDALLEQSNDAMEIDNLRMLVQTLSSGGGTPDEIDIAIDEYMDARKKYTAKYGVSWSTAHNTAVQKIYLEELTKKSAPATPVGIPGAPANVTTGTLVQTLTGGLGTVNGPVTMPSGQPGVSITLGDGTVTNVNVTAIKKAPDSLQQDFNYAPLPGKSYDHPTLGTVIIAGPPMTNPLGQVVVPVIQGDGSVAKATVASFKPPPPPPAGTFGVGTTVTTPTGDGTIIAVSPNGTTYHVKLPDGTTTFAKAEDTMEIPPSALPSAPAAASGFLPSGTAVSTPSGNGVVVGATTTSSGLEIYSVKMSSGAQINVIASDVAEITLTAPPVTAPPPAPNPGTLYDANGVPLLTPDQHSLVQAQFQNAGVNWYNSSESLFDAAYAASQATGMSVEDVLKYADANFHNSSKDGGKPIQAKIAKWAKSSKGKAHIQATLGSPAAAPITPTPAAAATSTSTPSTSATPSSPSPGAPLPGDPVDISGVTNAKQVQAFSQFTAGYITVNSSPGVLAQKAADVAKNTGLTPEQVLAIVDAKKAAAAGVPDGKLFSNKVLGHLNGAPFPPIGSYGPSSGGPAGSGSHSGVTAFPVTPGFGTITPTEAVKLQAQMAAASTPVTPSQRASLRYYTGSDYMSINKCLRFNIGCTPSIQKHIAQGTAGMRPTTQNITTFRGTGFAAFGVSNVAELEAMIGQTVQEPGFSSTSVLPGKAFGGSVAMQIEIPAGTPGAYVGSFSHHKTEREFLLPPGTKFRIIEVKPGGYGSTALVRVEVVPA